MVFLIDFNNKNYMMKALKDKLSSRLEKKNYFLRYLLTLQSNYNL